MLGVIFSLLGIGMLIALMFNISPTTRGQA